PQHMLAEAIDHAGLDPNALRILIGQETEGALIYPSFFCDSPEAWMRALAHLVTRHVNFRIFLTEVTGEHGGREVGRARVYPRFDTETSELLASIDLDESRLLEAYSARVETALAKMREHAYTVEPSTTADPL
ncbi:MAG: hypothetical protein VX596_02085, partial [Pseudomonadota bacterium]|nr:hypothetical protein [Pseudomonadota bacterium]